MTAHRNRIRLPAASAIEDAWQREAMSVAIAKARAVVSDGAVPAMTPIGRLSDTEWGWIAAGIIFGWVNTRATQATNNGLDTSKTIHSTGIEPNPWDSGAIGTILSELADAKVDWTVPLTNLSRDEMIAFLGAAYTLVDKAMQARELGERMITGRSPDGTAAVMNDPIPF
jgi:hypothetical protein